MGSNGSQGLAARVAVPTVLNPVGMDRERWREMRIAPAFAEKQEEVIAAYQRLGVRLECTCTPYYLNITRYGEHVAWSESSAVAYANSVIGARTNREGGPGALAAAIIGKTPYYGLHLVENRRPQVVVDATLPAGSDIAHYGALGYYAGKLVGNRIPLFRGIRPGRDELKALGAAMAATGAVGLFHVDAVTPDSRIFRFDGEGLEVIAIGPEETGAALSRCPGGCRGYRLPALLPRGTRPDCRPPFRSPRDETTLCLCRERSSSVVWKPGGNDREERGQGLCRHLHGGLTGPRGFPGDHGEQRQSPRVCARYVRGRGETRDTR